MSNNINNKQQRNIKKEEEEEEEYDICHVETGKRFKVKWTPHQDMRLLSQSRYCSPRQANKSAIRKSKILVKQRISKSLNFETGRNDRFKTPSSSGFDQFSRSAKIMRALNFNSCPGNNSKRKSVTKVLNFDITPSPKNLQSPASNFSTSSPIDSIHLSISSTDSHATSIDENQNRTPSNPRKSAKKSLNYLTPQSDKMCNSPRITISPVLRSDLKEKINNLIEINDTPNVHSLKRKSNKLAMPNDIVNTSRNLYYDFERECSDSSPCPSTPKNTCRPVPESMSAIKKSHRKERLLKKFETEDSKERILDDADNNDDDDDGGMHLLEPEDLSVSPQLTQHSTPNNRIELTNKSDKEDNNLVEGISECEDTVSETGSIFDYNRNKENVEEEELPELEPVEFEKEIIANQEPIVLSPLKFDQNHFETPKRDKLILKTSSSKDNISSPIKLVSEDIIPISYSTPLISRRNFNVYTPENDPSVIPDIIKSSIKKSHRKVKEEHRKRLIKPTKLHTALLNSSRDLRQCVETADQANSENRPKTPENLNSSRLLLPQFDSVKKSHKKEKLTKKIHGYARRTMLADTEQLSTSMRSDLSNVSMSLKNLLDESLNSQPSSVVKKKTDSFLEILPTEKVTEPVLSPSKKMKTPEGESITERSVEQNDDFQIFTPLRKRRTQLVPVDEPTTTNSSVNEIVDDRFVTPIKGIKVLSQKGIEDVTPEDRLNTTELVKDIEHSIKKSHRKDKLAIKQKLHRLNRSLNSSFNDSLNQNEINNPQPSTSTTLNDVESAITPPNCLKTKSYLHLLQNSSIKKLHKTEREKRRSVAELNRSLNDSSMITRSQTRELKMNMGDSLMDSDDGSIFSEEDRISYLEEDGAINANQTEIKEDSKHVQQTSLTEIISPILNHEKCPDFNESYQGTICNDSEKLLAMDEEI